MSSKNLAKQRYRLWLNNPRCHYCGMVTIYKPAHQKMEITPSERPRLATIDHIRPRHHPDRLKPQEPGEVLHVLACNQCNNDRDKRELAEKPKEWFEENGGQAPLYKRSDEELAAILSRLGAPYQVRRGRRGRENFNRLKRSQAAVIWAMFERGMD